MYTRKIITLLTLCMCIVSFTSCSDNEAEIVEKQVVSNDTKFPVIIDENTSQKNIVINGVTYTIKINNSPKTRGLGGDEPIYKRNPNATLASVPVLVSKGKYKKYARNSFSPFSELRGVSYILLKLDKFAFECKAPANAKPLSIDITNITKQGFTTEAADSKGFVIDKMLVTTTGVIAKCSFYIHNGIAYNIAGQQLTPETSYPLPGNQVQYQFTYELRN